MLPYTFSLLLTVFRPCFGAPSYRNFRSIVAGWVHCLGRRTVTAIALASGMLDRRHISVFHRFFTRAQWALDGLGRVLFQLAVTWLADGEPVLLILFRLYAGSKRGGERDAASRRTVGSRQRAAQHVASLDARPTKLELARE